jgi:hypothetical protein
MRTKRAPNASVPFAGSSLVFNALHFEIQTVADLAPIIGAGSGEGVDLLEKGLGCTLPE